MAMHLTPLCAFRNVLLVRGLALTMGWLPTDGGAPLRAPPQQDPSHPALDKPATNDAYLLPLRRESVPVKRKGKVVSFKTSYSGIINVGRPNNQEFRVVFDTGSGHVVLPSVECQSEACLVHRTYNMTASGSAVPINLDGSQVPVGDLCDRVTIGFGTGSVKGEFVREKVCLGPTVPAEADARTQPCAESATVMAIEMSTQPFKNFNFDGVIGLSLPSLSLGYNFSFFEMLTQQGQASVPHFAVFLTDGENGEESEIAFGGHNPERLLTPIAWTKVLSPDLGFWLLNITAFRVGDRTMDVCRSGDCRAILDTGTSHLGIPSPYDEEITKMLTVRTNDILDCRLAQLPIITLEVPGFNISLHPENYMRQLPIREDVDVNSMRGVLQWSDPQISQTTTTTQGTWWRRPEIPHKAAGTVQRFCRPKMMPVTFPEPMGPKLFILGEPVLRRYYTIFDWSVPQVGFSLSKHQKNVADRSQITDQVGELPSDMEVFLMQQRMKTRRHDEESDDSDDEVILFQIVLVASSSVRTFAQERK